MLNIVARKKSEDLQGYYSPDFRKKKWDVIGKQNFTDPSAARFDTGEALEPKWEVLGVNEFNNHIKAIEPKRKDGVIAYELCFSPPKSFSLAALTGEEISLELLRLHREAVTHALMFVWKYLVTRKSPEKRRFLERIPQVIWRFAHPWNDQMEPQLHEHALLLACKPGEIPYPDGKKKWGAIHAYPIYQDQMGIRAIYHYSLVNLLQESNYPVVTGPPGSLAWELEGFGEEQLSAFIDRKNKIIEAAKKIEGRYYSQGAEMRMASLNSRTKAKDKKPDASLRDKRSDWLKKLAGISTVPIRRPPEGSGIFEVSSLKPFFLPAAIQTFTGVAGRILSANLGSRTPLEDALEKIRRALEVGVEDGRLVASKYETYCHKRVLHAENSILELLLDGRAKGTTWAVDFEDKSAATNRARRAVASAALKPDRVRIESTSGEPFPAIVFTAAKDPSTDTKPLKWVWLKSWNPFAVVKKLMALRSREACVMVKAVVRENDFLSEAVRYGSLAEESSLSRSRQLHLGEVLLDVVEADVTCMSEAKLEKLFNLSGKETFAVLAPDLPRETFDELAKNLLSLHRKYLPSPGTPVQIAIPLLKNSEGWKQDDTHVRVLLKKRLGIFPRNSICRVVAIDPLNGKWELQGQGQRESLSMQQVTELLTQSADAVVFQCSPKSLRQGEQLQVLLTVPSLKLVRGELVRIEKIDDAVHLRDGRAVPLRFLPLSPAILLREIAPRAPGIDHLFFIGNSPKLDMTSGRNVSLKKMTLLVNPSAASVAPAGADSSGEQDALSAGMNILAKEVASALEKSRGDRLKREANLALPVDLEDWGHQFIGRRAVWNQLVGPEKNESLVDCASPFWLNIFAQQEKIIGRIRAQKARSTPKKQKNITPVKPISVAGPKQEGI